jgi:hypothetical protein
MGVIAFLRDWYEFRRDTKDYCKSCETYKEQLALANFEKKQLLERVLHVPEAKPTDVVQVQGPAPIMPRIVPYRVQRQMLEQEDRAKAATIRRQQEDEQLAKNKAAQKINPTQPIEENAISIEQLEKELGVDDAVRPSSSQV